MVVISPNFGFKSLYQNAHLLSTTFLYVRQGLKVRCSKSEPLKVMISGAPASGKGTQCEIIVQKVSNILGIIHCSHYVYTFKILEFFSPSISVSCQEEFENKFTLHQFKEVPNVHGGEFELYFLRSKLKLTLKHLQTQNR